MKGFNVKKIVALGIGAALVGSALAPVVSAAAYNNLDTLEASDVVSDAGVPVVDVVGGSNAMPSDIVWAGNIATRVAQLATVPAGEATGDATVDITVGGTVSTVGVGNSDKNTVDLRTGVHEFTDMVAKNGDIPTVLSEEANWEYKYNGNDITISMDENIQVDGEVKVQKDGDGIFAGETVMDIAAGDVVYALDLGNGIPYPMTDDSNSSTDIKVKLFGETYQVRSTTDTKMILRKSEASEQLYVGDTLIVPGIGDYEGKDLTVEVIGIPTPGTGSSTFESEFALKDGDTVLATAVEIVESVDLKEEFSDYISSSIVIDVIAAGTGDNRYVRVLTGESQIEIRNGQEFPYDASASSSDPEPWEASIVNDGTNRILRVLVKNKDLTYRYSDADADDLQGSGNDAYKMGPLPTGGEIDVAGMEKAKFVFTGLESNTMYENTIGNEAIDIRIDGANRSIPMVIGPFGDGDRDVTIAGKDFTVDVNSSVFAYFSKKIADVDSTTETRTLVTTVDKNVTATTLAFDVSDYEGYSTIGYYGLADTTNGDYWLVLAAQTLVVDNDATSPAQLIFRGTDTGETNLNKDGNVRPGYGVDVGYYLPDTDGVALLTTLATDLNIDGDQLPGDVDNMYQGIFVLDDDRATLDSALRQDVNIYIDTESGNLANSNDTKKGNTPSDEVVYTGASAYWALDETSTTASSVLTMATTMYGTVFSAENQVLTFVVPNEKREVLAFIGGADTTTGVTGGSSVEGATPGETVSVGGTDVTVTVAGGASGDGVSVVNAGDLVKLDTSYGGGRAVIVGGWVANSAAVGLEVMDGQTLEDLLVADGDYVAYVLDSGSIVVAGKTASDTGTAASALIDALEALV